MSENRSDYPGRPRRISGVEAENFMKSENDFSYTDLVPHTMEELDRMLAPGTALRGKFESEQSRVMHDYGYGAYFLYPADGARRNMMVRCAPRPWHRLALLASNSTLLLDPDTRMSWIDVFAAFDDVLAAVVGCSVGNGVAHALCRNMRPKRINIADPKAYHLANANRVNVGLDVLGRNKAVVTAAQLHAIDPFMDIGVYPEGARPENLDELLAGVTVLVDECDSLDMKVLLRERARERRIPVVMVTDLGSAVQLDIRRFDKDPALPLAACAPNDTAIYDARDRCLKNPMPEHFYAFVRALVGDHEALIPEYKRVLDGGAEKLFTSVPQLGSTVAAGAGIAAEAVARIALGHALPERLFVHCAQPIAFSEGRML